ncbi:hypothetical protein RKD24_006619 [Streptomyces calvus]|jgi:hypothetical protein
MVRVTGKSEAVYERLRGDIESLRLRPGAKPSGVLTLIPEHGPCGFGRHS